jgi:hypothetical protein
MALIALRQSLAFKEMNSREETIHKSHEDTFDWVLDYAHSDAADPEPGDETDNASFCRWLHGNDKLFWICGKAGSGKSTLMRKICRDDRLNDHLKQWAPEGTVTRATMFFTTEGTELQTSQEGLLRSLLHQALKEPAISVQVLTPHLSKTADDTGKFQWTLAELCTAFDDLLKLASTTQRFFFFVDGLDEYNVIATTSAYPPEYYLEMNEEAGRKIRSGHRTIAKLLLSAANDGYVKICVSSRPSNDIQFVFSQCPTFQLELLTKRDMELFVRDQVLDCVRGMSQTTAGDYWNCANTIVRNASGVFLWVSIATNILVDGIVNGDKPPQLRAMLDGLPTELGGTKGLYMSILERLDPQQRAEAWSMFNIMLHTRDKLTPLFLSFAVAANDRDAIAMRVKFLQASELETRCENINKRLRVLGNLLETQYDSLWGKSYVRFMHLTAKEFLLRADVQHMLTSNTAVSTLDTNVALLSTCLTMIRSIMLSHNLHERLKLVIDAVYYAAQAEKTTGLPQTRLLDNFNATMEIVSAQDPNIRLVLRSNRLHWNDLEKMDSDARDSDVYFVRRSNRLHWNDLERTDSEGECHEDFMSLAVESNLTLYVQQKLEDGYDLAARPGRPLLAHAMIPKALYSLTRSLDISDASMVRVLLQHHADFNGVIEFECHCAGTKLENAHYWPSRPSIWQIALASAIYTAQLPRQSKDTSRWADMVKTLLEHGASSTETIWWDPPHGSKPMQQSALFVCLYVSVDFPDCRFLPGLLISKGGRLLPGELEDLGARVRGGSPDGFESGYAFLRSFFPQLQLSPQSEAESDRSGSDWSSDSSEEPEG